MQPDKTIAQPTVVNDSVPDEAPETVSTPEGDNEFAPDQPLRPLDSPAQEPRGDEPHSTQPIRTAQN